MDDRTNTKSEADFLDQMSELEDDFDVDLMACGCRLAGTGSPAEAQAAGLSIGDMVRLFDLQGEHLHNFIGELIDRSGMQPHEVLQIAEGVTRGQIKEDPHELSATDQRIIAQNE